MSLAYDPNDPNRKKMQIGDDLSGTLNPGPAPAPQSGGVTPIQRPLDGGQSRVWDPAGGLQIDRQPLADDPTGAIPTAPQAAPQPIDPGGQAQTDPNAGTGLGGSADFPSLPPGATPPPGYVDPKTGKVAGAPAASPTAGTGGAGSADFPSLPPGATPPPGYVDPKTGKVAGSPAASPTGPTAGPAPASPGTPAPTASPAAPAADPNAPPANVNDAYKQALMKGLTQQAPTDINSDPVLKAQADAYGVQQQRAKERAREDLAGRAGASGQLSDLAGSGAFDQGLTGLEQQQGEAQGSFNAGLLGTAAQQQKDQLMKYAALAGSDMNAEQQRQLQQKLGELDAQIRREGIASQGRIADQSNATSRYGIDTQGALGRQELELRAKQGDISALLQLLSLNQNQSQFNTSTGVGLGEFGANRNDANFWKAIGGF